jgi:tetratricopeptide (TPR) repeat protein
VRQKLADANPTVVEFQNNLASIHANLGNLLSIMGELPEAETHLRRGLAIVQKLADAHPRIPVYRDGVAICQQDLADVLQLLGRSAEALDGYERAIAIGEALLKEAPGDTVYPAHLAASLRRRARVRGVKGDPAGAAADARRALAIWDGRAAQSGEEWFEMACCQATLASLAGRAGSGLSTAAASAAIDAAAASLHTAVAMGFRGADDFRTEPALDPLRDRPDFRLLLMDLAFPAEAFAQPE